MSEAIGFRNVIQSAPRLIEKIETVEYSDVLYRADFDKFFKKGKEIILIKCDDLEIYIHRGQGDKYSKYMWRIYAKCFPCTKKSFNMISDWHDTFQNAARDAHDVLQRVMSS